MDADGCISVIDFRGKLRVQVSLASIDHEVVRWVAHSITPPSAPFLWGTLYEMVSVHTKNPALFWQTNGSRAVSCLMRLHKYMVAQKNKALLALELAGQPADRLVEWQACDRQSIPPKHPSRPWVAGFIDGNGSFTGKRNGNSAECVLRVYAPEWKLPSLELCKKQYGGNICKASKQDCFTWELGLIPSKAKAFLEHDGVAKHLITKRAQAYFILGCARLGHYRDGEVILAGLRKLNSRPHRPSELDAGLVTNLLNQVRDVPRVRRSEGS